MKIIVKMGTVGKYQSLRVLSIVVLVQDFIDVAVIVLISSLILNGLYMFTNDD